MKLQELFEEDQIDLTLEPEYSFWLNMKIGIAKKATIADNWILDYFARAVCGKRFETRYKHSFKDTAYETIWHMVAGLADNEFKLFRNDFEDLHVAVMNSNNNGLKFDGFLELDEVNVLEELCIVYPPPFKFEYIKELSIGSIEQSSISDFSKWMPEKTYALTITKDINDCSGIHKYVKECYSLTIANPNSILGIMKIKGLDNVLLYDKKLEGIFYKNKKSGDVLTFQQDLIDAGYEEAAKL
jgi:hypothetical protein